MQPREMEGEKACCVILHTEGFWKLIDVGFLTVVVEDKAQWNRI